MSSTEIVFGTGNRHKGIELAGLLAPAGIVLKTLADFPASATIIEDGDSFRENAIKKAVGRARFLHRWTIAEDSGICVEELNGGPGIHSARFAGPDCDDEKNNDLLLEKLGDLPLERRKAWYTCYMVLADPEGNIRIETEGRCYGRILYKRTGTNGFGYDPLFEVVEYHQTFGQLPPEVKQKISHRAQAARQLLPRLQELIASGEITKQVKE